MKKLVLLLVLLTIAILLAVYTNPDWRQHMADPGGLIGSILPRHETYTASTKLPSSSQSSPSRVPLPDPSVSVSDDRTGGSAIPGSQALGGTMGPSSNTMASAPAPAASATPQVASSSRPALPASAPPPTPAAPASPRAPLPLSSGSSGAPRLSPEIAPQINGILRTRETSRGLVTMLPDALFDSGSALLSTTGQTRLAKIAGVILGRPGLRLEVDGYTGPAAVFQSGLSVGRASSVRLYLVSQGIDERNIVQRSVTVPPIETATGTELSRDVALVISAR